MPRFSLSRGIYVPLTHQNSFHHIIPPLWTSLNWYKTRSYFQC